MNKNGIIYIALGSAIVVVGIAMYAFDVVGYTGMLIFGFLVELYGVYTFWKGRRK